MRSDLINHVSRCVTPQIWRRSRSLQLHIMNFDKFQANTMARQASLPNPAIASPSFRRRRTIWFFILSFCACVFLFSKYQTFSSLLIPDYVSKSLSFSPAKAPPVSEIHGLQHFVLNSEASLTQSIFDAPEDEGWKLNPREEVDLRIYSSFDEDEDWEKHVKVLEDNFPVVIFSKVRAASFFCFPCSLFV